MKRLFLLFFVTLLHGSNGILFEDLYKDKGKLLKPAVGADVGEPLILTPFIQNGSIAEGRQAALVHNPVFQDVISYAGYFTVDPRFDSNLWFWYFPSTGDISTDPVLLWLNGGPGTSSLNGLFDENGPFIVNNDQSVSLREYSWHKNQSIIFVDNPVGVGFSFTNGGYAQNETKVGADLYTGLYQFFQLFPDLRENPFFLSGESYAGKYLPAIGYTILKNNPKAELKINLQGILIGNGWTDPINQLNYGPFLYYTGFVSAAVKEQIDHNREVGIALIKQGDWAAAKNITRDIQAKIQNNADVNPYNMLTLFEDTAGPWRYQPWLDFINIEEIRRALHVGNTSYGGDEAAAALSDDVMQSIVSWVEVLLENYKILFYIGQWDTVCGYTMALEYLEKLNFTGVEEYHNSSRDIWYVDDKPAGYVRKGGNLVELLVRNAGHMVPEDQPKSAYDMLYRFTRNIPFA